MLGKLRRYHSPMLLPRKQWWSKPSPSFLGSRDANSRPHGDDHDHYHHQAFPAPAAITVSAGFAEISAFPASPAIARRRQTRWIRPPWIPSHLETLPPRVSHHLFLNHHFHRHRLLLLLLEAPELLRQPRHGCHLSCCCHWPLLCRIVQGWSRLRGFKFFSKEPPASGGLVSM